MKDDYLPTCDDYRAFLDAAVSQFEISIDAARDMFGLFTYRQWSDVFKNEVNQNERS